MIRTDDDRWSYPDADAALALIDRGISGVGFDGPSPDPVDSTDFPLHRVWLGAGRLILENLTNLDLLPPRVDLVVAPMKVRGANGGPTRVFALGTNHADAWAKDPAAVDTPRPSSIMCRSIRRTRAEGARRAHRARGPC